MIVPVARNCFVRAAAEILANGTAVDENVCAKLLLHLLRATAAIGVRARWGRALLSTFADIATAMTRHAVVRGARRELVIGSASTILAPGKCSFEMIQYNIV